MWTSRNILINSTEVAIGASETNTIISEVERITGDPTRLIIDIRAPQADTTIVNGITAKIQTSSGNGVWVDNKTVAIADDADIYVIKLLADIAGDQTFLPIRPLLRVVVSSGVGDTTDIEYVIITYDKR